MTIFIESERRTSQGAWVAAGRELQVGDEGRCPLPVAELQALDAHHPAVLEVHRSGLTAIVYRVSVDGIDRAVKVARTPCLVQGVDGQTSFLNEVQRRAEFETLKAAPGGAERFAGVVDTVFASYRRGVIVSPWIPGEAVRSWDERRLQQVFDTGRELLRAGYFEWDFCPGNLRDTGSQVMLFDFGYTYRFNPLRQFNTAGNGTDLPRHHLAERIETRHAFGAWLGLAPREALAAFRQEKTIALATYRRLHDELRAAGATGDVLGWIDTITDDWASALAGDLEGLYLREGWRSHVIDLTDDLDGRTCTPATLQRADWLVDAVRAHHKRLSAERGLFGDDENRSASELVARYTAKRREAEALQVV